MVTQRETSPFCSSDIWRFHFYFFLLNISLHLRSDLSHTLQISDILYTLYQIERGRSLYTLYLTCHLPCKYLTYVYFVSDWEGEVPLYLTRLSDLSLTLQISDFSYTLYQIERGRSLYTSDLAVCILCRYLTFCLPCTVSDWDWEVPPHLRSDSGGDEEGWVCRHFHRYTSTVIVFLTLTLLYFALYHATKN